MTATSCRFCSWRGEATLGGVVLGSRGREKEGEEVGGKEREGGEAEGKEKEGER